MFRSDLSGVVTYVNSSWRRTSGFGDGEFTGEWQEIVFNKLIAEDYRQVVETAWKKASSGEEVSIEVSVQNKSTTRCRCQLLTASIAVSMGQRELVTIQPCANSRQ